MKIALDIDGCISEYPDFFRVLSHALYPIAHIVVLTARENSIAKRNDTINELKHYGIAYHELIITASKHQAVLDHGIDVLFEDTDEYFQHLPESVCVCKVREPGNFNFAEGKWVYGDKTGENIDSVDVKKLNPPSNDPNI